MPSAPEPASPAVDRSASDPWQADRLRQHVLFVRNALRGLGAGGAEVADLTQEVFLVAHRRRAVFQPERSSFRSWLYGIARRVFWTHCRTLRRRPVATELEPDGVLDPHPSPEAHVLEGEALERIGRALDALDPTNRVVFVRSALYDEPIRGVAADLGLTERAAYSRVHRVRSALRAA